MASLTLTDLWLHSAADNSDYTTFRVASFNEMDTVPAEVRRYTRGRTRLVKRPGTSRVFTFTTGFVPREDLEWLQGQLGNVLMLRDSRGRLLWGMVAALPFDELLTQTFAKGITLTFTEVSYDEAV